MLGGGRNYLDLKSGVTESRTEPTALTPVVTTLTPAEATSTAPDTNRSPTSKTAQPLNPRVIMKAVSQLRSFFIGF